MYLNDPDSSRATTVTLFIAFIIAGLIFVADRSSDRVLQNSKTAADTAISPALSALSIPLRATEKLMAELKDRSRALEENKALKEELYQLREEKERAAIIAMKLARFEQILGAEAGVNIPREKIAARAVSEINGPFVRSALINAGQSRGVKVGHPVMSVDGLYGHVLRAGPNSARVLRLGDLNSRIAVMTSRNNASAILSGDNGDHPILTFISKSAAWEEGDKVITSGDDGVLPRGLPVGTVRRDAQGRFVVDLHVTGKSVDWVWVYPFTPIEPPQDNDNAIEADASAAIVTETERH